MRWLGIIVTALALSACSSSTATTKKVTQAAGSTAGVKRAATSASTPVQDTYAVGDKIEISSGQTAQLYTLERPAQPTNQYIKPRAGNEYASADVEVCAGPNLPADKTTHANPFDFKVVMPDNTRIDPTLGAKEPALHDAQLQTNDCVRGWVTFEVPAGAPIKQVLYNGHTPDFKQIIVKWNVG
jgi:hypothetical protein